MRKQSRLVKPWVRNIAGVVCVVWAGCSGGEPGTGEGDAVPGIELPDPGKADVFDSITKPEDCPGGAPLLPNGNPATWTIIHYAAADNNLESVLLEDINEMEAGHRGTESVNIVVQLDKYSEQGVWRYHIKPDSDRSTINSPLVGYSEQEPDSGDWRTLAAFGQWATTCYPADYYAVIIGGHGSGWSGSEDDARSASVLAEAQADGQTARSIAPDDSHGTSMNIEELRRALTEIRQSSKRAGDPDWLNRMVLYGSDACLMATFEVTWDLRNTATYLIGSEETEPAEGWPYSTIIRDLTDRPSFYAQRPHEFAKSILQYYMASYGPWGSATRSKKLTLSVVDTSAALRAKNAFEKVTSTVFELSQETEAFGDALWAARGQTYNFYGFVDMALLFESFRGILLEQGLIPRAGQHWSGDPRARDLAQSLGALLDDVWPDLVLDVARGELYPDASGLSLYFPTDLCGGWSGGPKIDVYANSALGQATKWDELIVQLITKHVGVKPTYVGKGSATVTGSEFPSVEGLSGLPGLPVDCRFAWGQLTLRGSEGDVSFSATMKAQEGSLSLTNASMSVLTESGTQWFRLPWGNGSELPGTFAPDQSYEVEGVEVLMQTTDPGAFESRDVPVLLRFSCPTPTMQYCN